MRGKYQRVSRGARSRRHKGQALRRHVPLCRIASLLGEVDREVAGIDVVHERRIRGIGHIVGHHAANALKPHVGVHLVAHRTHDHALRLRPLCIASAVALVVLVRRVEMVGIALRRDALEVASAVEYLNEAVVRLLVDGEGAAAEHVLRRARRRIAIPVERRSGQTVHLVGVQHLSLDVLPKRIDGNDVLLDVGIRSVLFTPLARVALICREHVGLAILLQAGNAVRHIHAAQVAPPDVDLLVLPGIDLVRRDQMVLESQRIDRGERPLPEVQGRHGVGLLQRDERAGGIR